jgi:hypothetical protein
LLDGSCYGGVHGEIRLLIASEKLNKFCQYSPSL